MILPIVALIGQKNVGKSTLFNKLTCTTNALVADYPGLTRDRQYGYFQYQQYESILIDTGGIDDLFSVATKVKNDVHVQTTIAIEESDLVLFVVDGRFESSSIDYDIMSFLRKSKKNIFIIANKIDNILCYTNEMVWNVCFFKANVVIPVSAIHGHGIDNLLERIFYNLFCDKIIHKNNKFIKSVVNIDSTSDAAINTITKKKFCLKERSDHLQSNYITLAIIGKPNSGKSTFINYVLGKPRMIVRETPGTTLDSICIPVIYRRQSYILIDTAGIQKKNKIINQVSEKIAVFKTFKFIKEANVILFMIDVSIGVTDQDLFILQFIRAHARALVIAVNKYDMLSLTERTRITINYIRQQIKFINFAKIHFISALYGLGIKNIFYSVQEAHRCFTDRTVNTALLTSIMHEAIKKYPPPLLLYGKRVKPKYIHIGGYNPLVLVIHGSRVSKLSDEYQRYLKNFFYRALNIVGASLHIQLKDTVNPFVKH